MELVGGSAVDQGPYIYVGDNVGTGVHVGGAANPNTSAGPIYCHSGRMTYESCGHEVLSLDGSVCDEAGCTENVIVYDGGDTDAVDGDSGSPFYRYSAGSGDVLIRGLVIAVIGDENYAEKWSKISDHFDVSILN